MEQLNLLTFNLRINVLADGINSWDNRKEKVKAFLLKNDFDILCFQEVNSNMYKYLNNHLTSYISFYKPRDKDGEGVPIFIKKDKDDFIESKTIWLTNTPNVESKISSSNYTRIATYLVFKVKSKIFALFNTHLDNSNDDVTLKQSRYLEKYINKVKNKYNAYIIITGDFNITPNSKTYLFLSQLYKASYNKNDINQLTFNGFTKEKKGLPIDYIFVDKNVNINDCKIIYYSNYLSDHYPIKIILN